MANRRSQVLSRYVLTAIVLLCGNGMFACSRSWPSVTADTSGLGRSEIARVLTSYCCEVPEERIVTQLRLALKLASEGRSPRAAAEAIGFTCETPPKTACRYVGELKYQFHGLKENKEAEQVRVATYSIELPNYDNPSDIQVLRRITSGP